MEGLPNLIHKSISDYQKIKNMYLKQRFIVVEVDGAGIRDDESLYVIFKKKLNAPDHFYGNRNAFNDLFYDFFDLDNPNKMAILIRNGSNVKDKELWRMFLDILDDAVGWWKTRHEAVLEAIVFSGSED